MSSLVPSDRKDLISSSSGPGHQESTDRTAECRATDEEDFPPPNVILPKRTTMYMEPLTVLFCIAFQGLGPLISQYVYYRMELDLGINGTASSTSATASVSIQCNASDRNGNGGTGNASSAYELTQLVQSRTSTWILYRDILSASGAIIAIPLLNSSSDRLGRRLALILPCLGSLIESIVSLCVVWLHLPLVYMLVAAGVCGLSGGIGCLFAGALAYLADVTPARKRPMRITVLEALTGIGSAAASILVGWWIRWQGYLIPHAFCTLIYVTAAAFCLLLVPEVRQPAVGEHQRHRQPSPVSALCRLVTEPVRGLASLMTRPHSLPAVYTLVLCSLALYCATFYGTIDLTVIYSMNYPFCLDSVLIGYFSAARQFALQLGMLATVWLCRRLGVSTLTTASIGMASTALGAVLLALASDQVLAWLLWLSIAAAFAAACPVPMYRAFVSMVTPADKQGCMFSVFGVLQMLFYLLGNLAFTDAYKATLAWAQGIVFYAVAATLAAGLIFTVAAELVYRRRTLVSIGAVAELNGSGSEENFPGHGSVQYSGNAADA